MANKRIPTLLIKLLLIVCCIPALGAFVLLALQLLMLVGALGRVDPEAWLMVLTGACTVAGTVCSVLRLLNRPWRWQIQAALALGSLGFGVWLWCLASDSLDHSFCRMITLPGAAQGVVHLIWSALGNQPAAPRPIKRLDGVTALACAAVGVLGLGALLAALLCLPYKFITPTDWAQEWPMLSLLTGNLLTVLALIGLYTGKRGWLWGFAGLLAGHVFLCWRLYEMTYFMSDGGMVASIVLWIGLLQGAAIGGCTLIQLWQRRKSP